ncbi:MAG: hypothetical protein ABL903_19810 [Methylococcales bacterium]
MSLTLYKQRVAEGMENDILNRLYATFKDGGDLTGAVRNELVDIAIKRYSDKISAMLRRGGFDVANDEVLTLGKIVQIINDKTGLDITDLSEEGVMSAVDKWAAERASRELGFTVSTVFDVETLKSEVEVEVTAALTDGRALAIVTRWARAAASKSATWNRLGFTSVESRKTVLSAVYQKRYRRNNKWVWD